MSLNKLATKLVSDGSLFCEVTFISDEKQDIVAVIVVFFYVPKPVLKMIVTKLTSYTVHKDADLNFSNEQMSKVVHVVITRSIPNLQPDLLFLPSIVDHLN